MPNKPFSKSASTTFFSHSHHDISHISAPQLRIYFFRHDVIIKNIVEFRADLTARVKKLANSTRASGAIDVETNHGKLKIQIQKKTEGDNVWFEVTYAPN